MEQIAIHSVPRSGSTWLGSMFDAHPNVLYKFQPLFSYEMKDALNQNSTSEEISDFFKRLIVVKGDFIDQSKARNEGKYPFFKKENSKAIAYKEVRYHHILSNLMEKDKRVKVLGLVRDPRAVLSSWWNAPKEFKKGEWDFEEEWYKADKKNENRIEDFYGYLKWKEVAELFLLLSKQFPNRFKLIKYSNLLQHTEAQMQQLMEFCELSFSEQQKEFIQSSKSINKKDAYAVYKQKAKDDLWENELPASVNQFIKEDLKGTNLEQFLK